MPAVVNRCGDIEEDGWVAIQPNHLKRMGECLEQRATPRRRNAGDGLLKASAPVGQSADDRADDILFQTFCKNTANSGKLATGTGPGGLDALMQSQYFATAEDGQLNGNGDDVSLLSMHPVGSGAGDPLDELFGDDSCGYLHDDEPSEPCSPSPSLSLESSLMEELETSVSKADSAEIAVAFASLARKSTEKGQPTIISMRLVPKSKGGAGGLAVPPVQHGESKEVFSRMSVVGPIDLADPDEVARAMARNSQNAYLVTECHPGPDLEDFASLDKEMQSDLLWDWSIFREAQEQDNMNKEDYEVKSKPKPKTLAAKRKECLLGDLLQNSILFPMTKRTFWEVAMPALVATHFVSVLVGVVIGRRLALPETKPGS